MHEDSLYECWVADDEWTTKKGVSEMDELRYLLHKQHLEVAEMKEQFGLPTPSVTDWQVILLPSMKYTGEGDFVDYLS